MLSRVVRALRAISAWATVEKAGKVADLALKLSAIVVALLAVNFFILRPAIVGESVVSLTRVDLDELKREYASDGLSVPAVVVKVLEQYERNRAIDARQREYPNYDYSSTAKRFCQAASASEVRDVVPMPPYASCEGWAAGQEWEINLVFANVAQADPILSRAELEDALIRVRDALYFEQFYRVRNEGTRRSRQRHGDPAWRIPTPE